MGKKASKKAERLPDPNETAFGIVQALTGDATLPAAPTDQAAGPALTPDGKNAAAVALGKLGGAKGGKARAAKLSAKKRSEIAKKAARARWQGR
jgi:hypothetical protein